MHKHFYLVSLQALIELLDQVEDVISVESSSCKDGKSHLDVERFPKADLVVHRPTTNSAENRSTTDSNINFLVLEVCTNTLSLINSPCLEYKFLLKVYTSAIGFRKARTFWIIWSSMLFQGKHVLFLSGHSNATSKGPSGIFITGTTLIE